MNKLFKYFGLSCIAFSIVSCSTDEIRNIAGENSGTNPTTPAEVNPVNINVDGFDLLEKLQGHWIGTNRVIADDYDWFAFDYRAISPSHIHGMYEGGSGGNLLTSFFVTDFKDTRTIMARNGGLLNGIYRTSYFVLDEVREDNNGKHYRLVDAKGGTDVMYMELRFKQDSLYFNAYTSRLGLSVPPSRHMTFKAKKEHLELSQTAATAVNFPQNTPAWDFSNGFNEEFLYVNAGDDEAKSASFLAQQDADTDVFTLAFASGDPFRVDEHPYMGYLQLDVVRDVPIADKHLFIYLSRDSLTDANGYLQEEPFNTVLKFPEMIGSQDQFLFTYMHPGTYYVTVIADANDDGFISQGDLTHVSQAITIDPEGQHQITINNINVQN